MTKNYKDLMVSISDHYGNCLKDRIAGNEKMDIDEIDRPKGFVEIYEINEDGKQLLGKHNLVVYLGREWLISRAFNYQNANITPTYEEYISWFGIGNGGCPIGDPLTPVSPTNEDSDLDNSIMINETDVLCADYRATWDSADVEATGYYKHPFDSLTFEQDSDNYNRWLIMKVSTTIGAGDANGYNLSEAGLFTSESNAGGYIGHFNLYARVTFPTIVKNSSRQLLFVWYVYF